MLNSFVRLVRVDPGFQSDHLLTIRFDLRHAKYMSVGPYRFTPSAAVVQQQFLERIEALPEVDAVGLVSADAYPAPVSIPGRPAAACDEPFGGRVGGVRGLGALYMETSPAYFRTLRIPLLKGRGFTAYDAAGAPGVPSSMRPWPASSFLGRIPSAHASRQACSADLKTNARGARLPPNDVRSSSMRASSAAKGPYWPTISFLGRISSLTSRARSSASWAMSNAA